MWQGILPESDRSDKNDDLAHLGLVVVPFMVNFGTSDSGGQRVLKKHMAATLGGDSKYKSRGFGVVKLSGT